MKTVIVTGASTGIGAACALLLSRSGYAVLAGVRREEDGAALAQRGPGRITPLLLDVTDEGSIAAAARTVGNAVGDAGLYGLVNNAGIVVSGPLELLPLSELRRLFEVNVFGSLAVTQALLPLLRRCRGRVVNIGSIVGRMPFPFIGPYAASKAALAALTDVLRLEVLASGVAVSLIEPGSVATPIWGKSRAAAAERRSRHSAEAEALYGAALGATRALSERIEREGAPPESVASAVVQALGARRPLPRYLVGRDAWVRALMVRFVPQQVRDRLILRKLGMQTDQRRQRWTGES